MKRLIALFFISAIILSSFVAASDIPSATREVKWEQDIDFFAREYPKKHKDFYKLMPKDRFGQEIADLKHALPQLSDAEVVLSLQRLIASLGVAHDGVWLRLHSYPLELAWFSDGLYILGALPEYHEAIGARIVRIGSMTPQQLETAVAPYIPHENDAWLHESSPGFMAKEELLQHLHIANSDGSVELMLVKSDGQSLVQRVLPCESDARPNLVRAADALHIPAPLTRKQSGYYWYEYLADSQALYIQYNVCNDAAGNPFKDFTKNLFAFADAHKVQRVIVDLRFNGGGSSTTINPLMDGLRSRPALGAKGHLYVLIGAETFSSGLMAATNFRYDTRFEFLLGERWLSAISGASAKKRRQDMNAILIGQPTGGKPNSYGELGILALPNSGLKMTYSIKYFRLLRDADPPSLEPDLTVPLSFKDYLAGRDPVLEMTLHHALE